MSKIYSYLLTFFGIIFWLLRVVVAIMETLEKSFICTTLNLNIEIIIIFITFVCWLFMFRRSLVFATIYMGLYCSYFGVGILNLLAKTAELGIIANNVYSFIFAIFGVVISILTFLDILTNKNRKDKGLNGKGSWFYENKELDRQFDERADRNQYKIR